MRKYGLHGQPKCVLENGGVPRKSIISIYATEPRLHNLVPDKSLDTGLLSLGQISKLSNLHIHEINRKFKTWRNRKKTHLFTDFNPKPSLLIFLI